MIRNFFSYFETDQNQSKTLQMVRHFFVQNQNRKNPFIIKTKSTGRDEDFLLQQICFFFIGNLEKLGATKKSLSALNNCQKKG
jgi:hypothetical protein